MKSNISCLLSIIDGAFDVLTTPGCWIQNYSYSAKWDAELNRLMAREPFKYRDTFKATIGAYTVWIENHPYASFTRDVRTASKRRPKRSTILKAHRKYIEDMWHARLAAACARDRMAAACKKQP